MKLRNKKGFTIIELVIVIAVIGILTAVLVPTFINLTNKANQAADESLVKNLNTALKMEEQLVGNPKNETLQDAIEDLKNEGYLLENLVSKTGHDLLWDQEQNQFVLNEKTDLKDGKYWQIVDKIPETQRFSYYAGKNFKDTEVLDLEYGFDAGEYSKIENLEYEPKSGTAKTTRIRTNSDETTLTINAPLDVVKHYGDAKALNIIAVKGSSYHENGKVSFLEISKGRVVLEYDSQVKHIHVSAKTNEQGQKLDVFDSVTIAKEPTKEMPVLSRDDVEIASTGTLVVALQNGTEEVTEQSDLDYVWLTKQGIYEQIKISDSSASAGNVWVSDSDKSEQTKTAAQQIANNYISETVRPTWESGDTERDIANIKNKTEVATAVAQEEAGEAWSTMTEDQKAAAVDATKAVVVDKDIAVEKVADKKDVEKGATLFAGGTGTERDPFLIYDYATMQNVSTLYDTSVDRKVKYFKVKDGVTTIDCDETGEGWTSVEMLGSFDGNGVTFVNLNKPLFSEVNNEATGDYDFNVITIKNMNIKANMVTDVASALINDLYSSYIDHLHLVIDSVNVEGYLEGSGGGASYIVYGPHYSCYNTLETPSVIFKNCISTAAIVATGDNAAGFVKHGGGAYFNVIDSLFLGTLSDTNNTRGYFNANATTQFHGKVTYSEGFLAAHGINDDTSLYTYPTNGSLNSVNADYTKWVAVQGTKLNKSSQPLPEGAKFGDTISISKATNATKAIVTLWIAPNNTSNVGSYLGCYMTEEIDLTTGDSHNTSSIRYFDIQINGSTPVATKTKGNSGYSSDAKVFNVVSSFYGNTHNGAYIQIVQYSSNGTILSIQTVSIA